MTGESLLTLSLPDDHVGLYVHVPFCVRKCHYCDFPSQPLGDKHTDDIATVLTALAAELAQRRASIDRPLASIYIGGGTPTLLGGAGLRALWALLDDLPRRNDAEITIEANPGTLSDDLLAALADLPITRVSLGVQSLRDEELRLLGRIHTAAQVPAAVAALRATGIPALNLDLISALPGQPPAHWEETLLGAIALEPDHISAYALILEAGTPLCAAVEAGAVPEPEEDSEAEMAELTTTVLGEGGYQHYEVSNFARPGCHSRHNLGYWLGRDYLGLGPAATSCLHGTRWRNTDQMAAYAALLQEHLLPVAYAERLAAPTRLLEMVMLGLRLCNGFDLAAAERVCGCTLADISPAYATLCAEGALIYDEPTLRLSRTTFRLANTVVTQLMTDA